MKRFIIIALLAICNLSVGAQGIKFFKGTYAELLEEAKKQDKKIFIDFYTKWCGPCRAMAKEVFPLKPVGDFYNEHFICYKIDAEKGEGPMLAKKYKVKGYPTFTFTDADGNSIYEGTSIGASTQEGFLRLARLALGLEKKTWAWYEEEYKKGVRTPKFLRAYYNARYAEKGLRTSNEEWFTYYMAFPEAERWNEENTKIAFWGAKYNPDKKNGFYEVLINNKDRFPQLKNQNDMVGWMLNSFYACGLSGDVVDPKFEKVRAEFEKRFPEHLPQAVQLYMTERLRFAYDSDNHVTELMKYVDKYGKPTNFNFMISFSAVQAKNITKEHALYLRDCFKDGIEEDPIHLFSAAGYIYLSYKAGLKDEALAFAKKHKSEADKYRNLKKMKWSCDVFDKVIAGETPGPMPPLGK